MDNKPVPPAISLQDLQNVLVLIDLACSRGAIRAAELTSVGQLYDKIQNFVKQNVTTPTQENAEDV
jgi:hypothetical protein